MWFDVYYLFIGLILISRITGTKRDMLLLTDILLYIIKRRGRPEILLISLPSPNSIQNTLCEDQDTLSRKFMQSKVEP